MIALSEREVRDQLASALEQLDPPPPPLDELRSRAKRRTNRFRWGSAGVLAVAAAAVVAVLVVVIPNDGGSTPVQVATAPTRASLTDYASAHGGAHVTGPLHGLDPTAGYFGAYSTKRAIVVVRYAGSTWSQDGAAITALGRGTFVQRIGAGPATNLARPSFAVRIIGGDVSYFGGVLVHPDASANWFAAKFGTCGHHKLCYPGTTEPYGHPDKGGFVSVHNTCTPNCAEGNDYRVRWHWSGKQFVAVSETPVKE
jgi:hypothetical protein